MKKQLRKILTRIATASTAHPTARSRHGCESGYPRLSLSQSDMNMHKVTLSIFLCLCSLQTATASSPGTYDLKGAGISSCGTWTQDRLQGSDSEAASIDEQWVLGFIVGQEYVISSDADKNYTIKTDSNGIFGWIDNYCQQNPVQQIVDAAESFINNSGTIIPTN